MSLKKGTIYKGKSPSNWGTKRKDGHVRYWSASSESADADSALPLHMRDERGRSDKQLLSMEEREFFEKFARLLAKGEIGSIQSPNWHCIPLIYQVYIYILLSRGLYNPYHFLQEPESRKIR